MHKKQTGGAGQYGRVIGYIEPLPLDHPDKLVFQNHIVGNAIPPEFILACEKGFYEATTCGELIGHPVQVIFNIFLKNVFFKNKYF